MLWNLVSNLFTQKKERQLMEVLSKQSVTTETSPIIRDFSRAKRQIHRIIKENNHGTFKQ